MIFKQDTARHNGSYGSYDVVACLRLAWSYPSDSVVGDRVLTKMLPQRQIAGRLLLAGAGVVKAVLKDPNFVRRPWELPS